MPGKPLVLGTRKALLFERANGDWSLTHQAHPGIPVAHADRDRRAWTLWARFYRGHWGQKISRSQDMGRTWTEVTPPAYPDGAGIKPGHPATLRYLWVLQPGPSDKPGRIYLGTEPGGLFQSDDHGRSWQFVCCLLDHPSRRKSWFGGGHDHGDIRSVIVVPRDWRRIPVEISVAGVFESMDERQTWSPRNKGLRADYRPDPDAEVGHDPHLPAACPAHPETLWQQNHCGIFKSEDDGQTWNEVSEPDGPAGFGFAAAVHERVPRCAWVVPAVSDEQRMAVGGALCGCRTEACGRTWTALRNGLPQHRAYHIVLRHALALSGQTPAFGTSAGNASVSEDGGEAWTCLGNDLPPVYSARFVPGG